jgi:S2P endopeptidase
VTERTCKSNVDCNADEFCVRPVLPAQTMIIRIQRSNADDIFFAGDPIAFFQMLHVSVYTRRWSWMTLLPLEFPIILYKFLTYIVSISGALALLNLAPVPYLDGEHALQRFLILVWQSSNEQVRVVCRLILRVTTILLILNLIVSLAALYIR